MSAERETSAAQNVTIDLERLSDLSLTSYNNLQSSFFRSCSPEEIVPRLPPPDEVLQALSGRGYGIVTFEHLRLVVKYGGPSEVRLEGAVAMQAVQQAFQTGDVPVPELFGWRVHEGLNFIYMSLVPGITLSQVWTDLDQAEKSSVASDLRQIVVKLRSVTRSSDQQLIGSINGGAVLDNFFRGTKEGGPYDSVREFNNALSSAAVPEILAVGDGFEDPYRELLGDEHPVYLCHADLNLTNVMVSGSAGSRSVSGIIDWDQSGWYPEYWEYCKMAISIHYEHEWRTASYLDLVTGAFEDEFLALAEYTSWRGF
ncbi:Hypothetical predicted protein [Lecanosticta acicola]|uniref:Aminoglycoside phosphotransferase domain-containing protein n=1 Tax=Lecanosticta acicola TaxID=111012 RepID=A0AAI8Z8W1_9PEZI|nr:Hypothetical predicted protein [Lecanosticta acicola]